MAEPIENGVVVVRGGAVGFTQEITAGRHRLTADEPASSGGTDRGPLGGVTVHLCHSRIHAEDCAECETKQGMLDRIEREIAVAGELTEDQRTKLLEIANKCPVHRTLTSEINIRTTLP